MAPAQAARARAARPAVPRRPAAAAIAPARLVSPWPPPALRPSASRTPARPATRPVPSSRSARSRRQRARRRPRRARSLPPTGRTCRRPPRGRTPARSARRRRPARPTARPAPRRRTVVEPAAEPTPRARIEAHARREGRRALAAERCAGAVAGTAGAGRPGPGARRAGCLRRSGGGAGAVLVRRALRVLPLDRDAELRPQRPAARGEEIDFLLQPGHDPLEDELAPGELHPRRRLLRTGDARLHELLDELDLLADVRTRVGGVEVEVEAELRRAFAEMLLGGVAVRAAAGGVVRQLQPHRSGIELHVDAGDPVVDARALVALERDQLRLGQVHHVYSSRIRPSWAICSSSIATSPVRAFSCGPLIFAGSPRTNVQVAPTFFLCVSSTSIVPS